MFLDCLETKFECDNFEYGYHKYADEIFLLLYYSLVFYVLSLLCSTKHNIQVNVLKGNTMATDAMNIDPISLLLRFSVHLLYTCLSYLG